MTDLWNLDTAIQYLKDNLTEPLPWQDHLSIRGNAEHLANWTAQNQGEFGAAFYTIAMKAEDPTEVIGDINSSLR